MISDEHGRGLVNRPEIIAAAHAAIARGSKSFTLASQLFDARTRERAWLLYAWCRACDDIADGQDHGGAMHVIADAPERVRRLSALTDAALDGRATGLAAFDALGVVAAECGIPHVLPHDVIAGFALDAAEWRPRSEADLLRYCYHVAGAVGRMMAIVMEVRADDADLLDRATDLGIAFQLANIARDLSEDNAAGRCYLPDDWLGELDLSPGEHMRPLYRDRVAVAAKRLADLADRYDASARAGAARLPFRSRWAVLAAANIYGGIAREVRRRGPHAWDRRVVTTKAQKLDGVLRALGQAALNRPVSGSREGLWTRGSTPLVPSD